MSWIQSYGLNGFNESIGMLLFRVTVGASMLTHGLPKLMSFTDRMDSFSDPLGVGSLVTLCFAVFSEFFCSVLIILGLKARLAAIPLIITMSTATFIVHSGEPFGSKEKAVLFLASFVMILFAGPGRYSFDKSLRR